MDKKTSRLRRAKRTRMKIRELGVNRLVINKTPRHIYAQLIAANGSQVLASASTVEKDVRAALGEAYTGNVEAAKLVGKLIAERGLKAGAGQIAFDRSGFKYHGRVQALADSAREHGLQF